jgi:hypothetical protein
MVEVNVATHPGFELVLKLVIIVQLNKPSVPVPEVFGNSNRGVG